MTVGIETRALTKSYRSNVTVVHALRGVDFEVGESEFVALMGPSGCGKTTLLHVLGGLERPTAGEVYLRGMRIDDQGEDRLAVMRRGHVGFVFQFFNLIENLTVADNVDLPALLLGVPRRDAARCRDDLLRHLGIADKAGCVPSQLSGGEQQRVALARALINDPAVILADEPTGNLDSKSGAEVLRLLETFHDQGQTVVLVTHDARVASAADRVIFLRDGVIIDQMTLGANRHEPSEILDRLVQLEG